MQRLATLTRLTSEAPGANCKNEGQKVEAGPDSNSNGILDPAEVSTTSYVCNGPGIYWVNVTAATQQAVANTGYLANSSVQVTITLPASAVPGDVVSVSGLGTGGWKVAQNAGQSIITQNVVGSIGALWTARDSSRSWTAVASSTDGSRLVAVAYGGQIYTSTDFGVS